jgi:lysophospholipase L1-like esterase
MTGGGGYRIELFRLAVEAGLDITYVGGSQNGPTTLPGTTIAFPRAHEGHSGQTIQWIIDNRIKQGALNVNPHIVLLHIGTNDMWAGPAGAPTRLGTLIDELTTRLPNALVVISNIVPWPSDPDVGPYNAQIPNVVEQRRLQGKNVLFVDQFTGFVPGSELATDGIHPNAAGYKRMGAKWYGAIYEHLVNIN